MLELILGGARSGKSRLAERLATQSGLAVTYIATSQALDGEMSARIQHHRQRRPADWGLVEEPLELARAQASRPGGALVLALEGSAEAAIAAWPRLAAERERLLFLGKAPGLDAALPLRLARLFRRLRPDCRLQSNRTAFTFINNFIDFKPINMHN